MRGLYIFVFIFVLYLSYIHGYCCNSKTQCGGTCIDLVCYGGNNCGSNFCYNERCIECNRDSQCPRFCKSEKCVDCLLNNHCQSDNTCGAICSGLGSCYGGTSCAAIEKRCKNGIKCVDCLTHSDCQNSSKSFCDIISNTCKECIDASHCRSNIACDSTCQSFNCISGSLNCTRNSLTSVCNPVKAVCQSCYLDNECLSSEMPRCDSHGDGKCYKCVVDAHCRSNSDCSAICVTLKKVDVLLNVSKIERSCISKERPINCVKSGLTCDLAQGVCNWQPFPSSSNILFYFGMCHCFHYLFSFYSQRKK